METQPVPYGAWPSVITSEEIVRESVRLGTLKTDGDDVYWLESRPSEHGRGVIVRRGSTGEPVDMVPPGYSARTRVHEYGGGDFLVHNGTVYFSNDSDQRMYRVREGEAPEPVTPEGPWRYADGVFDAARNRIICVVEEAGTEPAGPKNVLAEIRLDGDGTPQALIEGADFYSNPVLSPDGAEIAWLHWNHPNLPWDGTELWLADFDEEGHLVRPARVAGGEKESVFQPQCDDRGRLYYVSDRTGFWNLYRVEDEEDAVVIGGEREVGLPQWVFGMSTYALLPGDAVAAAYSDKGIWHAVLVDGEGVETRVVLPYTDIHGLRRVDGGFAFLGGSPGQSTVVARYAMGAGRHRVLRRSSELNIGSEWISQPQHVMYPVGQGEVSHGFFYPPAHPDCLGPEEEKPPLIVKIHGGPTSVASTTLDPRIQFWTSRGFAVLDVNYRGSTGFGRAYREKLNGEWGIADVEDCVAGAEWLAERGKVDEKRLIITGGSAGGYTTLAALAFHDVFRAGASYYGVSDLEALARDTHKFEARYLDGLVGAYPEQRAVYQERSPIHHPEELSCPVIFFQGNEDKVVPPNQSEGMVEVLKKRGVPVAYVLFEGEGHGFRQAETIRRALDSELYFYGQVFGFEPADVLDPVVIENLAER